MNLKINKFGAIIILVSVATALLVLPSLAEFRRGWVRSLPIRHQEFGFRGERFHFFAGRFYRPAPHGFYIIRPPIGAAVSFLPDGYLTVIVGGAPYYYYDSVYYRSYNTQYIVVSPPVNDPSINTLTYAGSTEYPPGSISTVNVPNSKGSFTAVKLTKYGNGYLGPQGEYYPENPTVDQLKVLYGK